VVILPGGRDVARRLVGQPGVRPVVVAVDVGADFPRASSMASNSSRQTQRCLSLGDVRPALPCKRSAPAAKNCSRHLRSRLSAISCSRQSSVIDLGPRSDASTISIFCWALNLRYFLVSLFLVSLNENSSRMSGPSAEARRTRSPLRSGPPGPHVRGDPVRANLTDEVSTPSRGPRQNPPGQSKRSDPQKMTSRARNYADLPDTPKSKNPTRRPPRRERGGQMGASSFLAVSAAIGELPLSAQSREASASR
jgi:hypothetical protein